MMTHISNIMDAIEQGIITDSTKDRLSQLESKKKELEITILQEKIKKPFLTQDQIRFGIEKFRKLDITTQDGKRRLIDGFVNSIYLFDDKVTLTFNFKDGTQTVYLPDIEVAKNSDIKCLGVPKTLKFTNDFGVFVFFLLIRSPICFWLKTLYSVAVKCNKLSNKKSPKVRFKASSKTAYPPFKQ